MLARWARLCARHRWLVLVLWALLLLGSLPLAAHVTHNLSSSGFEDPRSRAVWADHQLNYVRASGESTWLVEGPSLATVLQAARTAGIPSGDVRRVGRDETLVVPMRPIAPAASHALHRALQHLGARVRPVDQVAVGEQVLSDAKTTLAHSLPFALPLVLILLLLVFGSVASAALPLAVAGVGSSVSLALIDLIEDKITLSAYLTDIVTFLALGVGVDYALFISVRFREELRAGRSVPEAIGEAMRHAGRSVLYSGVAVAFAVATLLLGGNAYWQGIAVGGAVAVFSVLLATHTLLPALLAIVGRGIDWGRLPRLGRGEGIWPRLGRFVGRAPAPALLAGLLLLMVPGWFGLGLQIRTPANLAVLLPPHDPLRKAVSLQTKVLGAGVESPILLALKLPSTVQEPAFWQEVEAVTAKAAALQDVRRVASPTALGAPPALLAQASGHPALAPPALSQALGSFIDPAHHPHLVLLYVTPRSGPDAAATLTLVHHLQQDLPLWLPSGSQSGVGGVTALLDGFNRLTSARLPYIILGVALIAFLVLFGATGALWQALLGVAFDALVALATAGILVLTVQRGGLGFEALPPDSSITPLIFVLLFGLSMDYEVILLHRVQEAARRMGAPAAASDGLAVTGGMITGAGMTLCVVFVALLLSPLEIMQMLAVGMTTAILLDTWIVRTLLVPGSIALLGRFAFWPWGKAAQHAAH